MFFSTKQLFTSTLLAISLVSASPVHHNDDSLVDWGRLSSIVDSIDSHALHNVLHNLAPKFKEGVFSKDRAAIEHVHSKDPIMASKLVYMAKRQSNDTTSIAVVGGTTSSSVGVVDGSTTTAIAVIGGTTRTEVSSSPTSREGSSSAASSRPATTTAQQSVDSSVSAALSSQIMNTASATPSPTVISVAPSTPVGAVPVSTVSGAVVFSTTGGGLVTRTSSAVSVSFTKSTSTHLYYTTLPDGTVQTSTSLVVVNAPVTGGASATAAGASTSSAPGLQNAARPGKVVEGTGAIFGLLGFLLAL